MISWVLIVWLLNGTARITVHPSLEACVQQSHVEMRDPQVRAASCRPQEGQPI